MTNQLKQFLKFILFHLHLDLTRNQQYDRQTMKIMKLLLRPDSSCIDIGCHKGEMLDYILKFSPHGPHWGFEPLPQFYKDLTKKYFKKNITILPFALSDSKSKVTFNHVVNDPAFSGLQPRKYHCPNPVIEQIEVDTERLDNIIGPEHPIDFIKIDVEGGEYGVLKGAEELLKRDKPVIIFEFGLGAADYYHTTPDMMVDLFEKCGLKISLLKDYLRNKPPLSKEQFNLNYQKGLHYYFIAHP